MKENSTTAKYIRYVIAVILFITMIACMVITILTENDLFKGIASGCYVLFALFNLIQARRRPARYPMLIMIALILAIIGDLTLRMNFPLGAGSFALCHVLYIVAYHLVDGFRIRELIYTAFFGAGCICVFTLLPWVHIGSPLMWTVCIAYSVIVSFMAGKAISNAQSRKDRASILTAIASCMFWLSDVFVLLATFSTLDRMTMRSIDLGLYYPAQFILAYTIYLFFASKDEKQ